MRPGAEQVVFVVKLVATHFEEVVQPEFSIILEIT
jgi:hypothetical protein